MLTVKRARTSRDIRRFVDFDRELHVDEPLFAPPLREGVHRRIRRWVGPARAAHRQAALFLVEEDGRVRGRISASVDRRRAERAARPTGAFGFLEAVDSRSVFGALFGAAEEWLTEHGAERVVGPYSFTPEDPYVGLLAAGFEEPPTFGMTWTPPYYPAQIEALGYERVTDLRSYVARPQGEPPPALRARAAALREARSVAVRPVDLEDAADAQVFRTIVNAALAEDRGTVAFTPERLRELVRDLRFLLDPRLTLIATLDGEPAGCVVSLPDWNDVLRAADGRLFPFGLVRLLLARRRRTALRGHALAVVPRARRMGVASLLVCETWRAAVAAGYREAEVAWVPAASAPMLALADRFARPTGKVHRLYAKDVGG